MNSHQTSIQKAKLIWVYSVAWKLCPLLCFDRIASKVCSVHSDKSTESAILYWWIAFRSSSITAHTLSLSKRVFFCSAILFHWSYVIHFRWLHNRIFFREQNFQHFYVFHCIHWLNAVFVILKSKNTVFFGCFDSLTLSWL